MGVYNEEELLSIIKRMQNDGRSENEIASVIKEYEKENPPGKTNGDVVDANATSGTAASGTGTGQSQNNQTNTGLESGSGSSELQVKPNTVVKQGGYEYKYTLDNEDKPIYHTKKEDSKDWVTVDPNLNEEGFITNPAYLTIGQEFGHFGEDVINREDYLEKKEKEVAKPKEFNHIPLEEFAELSENSFGFFGDGREETIVPRLQEIYGFDADGNESGISFEESGTGNNVKITLPGNTYGEVFNLPHSDDLAEMQKAHNDITQYIESQSQRKRLTVKADEGIDWIFNEKNPNRINDNSPIDITRDRNIARELNLLLSDSDYEFTESSFFTDAINVKLPNGNERVFNISDLRSSQKIKDFIQADSRSYNQTKKYKEDLSGFDDAVTEMLNKYSNDIYKAMDLGDPNATAALKKHIINELGSAGWQQMFFADDEQFQNLSRDEKGILVDGRISEIVNNAFDAYTDRQAIEQTEIYQREGKTDNEIANIVESKVYNSFTGDEDLVELKQLIFKTGLEIDNPLLDEAKRGGMVALLDSYKDARNRLEGREYNYFLDPTTGKRALNADKENLVEDLTGEVTRKQEGLSKENLTRSQLRTRWMHSNLAYAKTSNDWSNELRRIEIPGNRMKDFLTTYSDIRSTGDGGVLVSDAFIAKNDKYGWFDDKSEEYSNYRARMAHLKQLATDNEVYNKMYALNEDLKSQKKQGFVEAVGTGFVRSVTGDRYDLRVGVEDDQMRQAYLDVMHDMNIETTAEEDEYAKTTTAESSGKAVGGIPKIATDFAIAGRMTNAIGWATGLTKLTQSLLGSKFIVNGVRMNRSKFINYLRKNAKTLKVDRRIHHPSSSQSGMAAANWVAKNPKIAKIDKADIIEKGAAASILGLTEGIKMEFAMQDPLGLDNIDSPIGSSFSTGVGFGLANSIMPWGRILKGIGLKSGVIKGVVDYGVVAPVNFYTAAQLGKVTNAITDHLLGSKTWNNFLEENYSDFDEIFHHAITDLTMGFAMKLGHIKKYDFASRSKLERLQRECSVKMSPLVEDVVVDGKVVGRRIVKGKEKEYVKLNKLKNMAEHRLHQINDTQEYLDPILGPLKLYKDHLATLKDAGVEGSSKFRYDFNMPEGKKMSHQEVKPGEKLGNGKINNTKKTIQEFTFNPKEINPGLAPHELGHFGLNRLFTEDVIFKTEFVNSMESIMRNIKTVGEDPKTGENKEMSLLEAFENAGVYKRQPSYRRGQVKIEEMFAFTAEFLSNPKNLKDVRRAAGFNKFANLISKNLRDKLSQNTNLNLEKEVVQWFGDYIETIKKGKSAYGNLKALEKFIDPELTKKQRQIREKFEKENPGAFESREMRSERLDKLNVELKEAKDNLKGNPHLQDFKDKKITVDQYKELTKGLKDNIIEIENSISKIKALDVKKVKPQNIFESVEGDKTFENQIQREYDKKKDDKGRDIPVTDRAYYITQMYDPRVSQNPGAGLVAKALEKFRTPENSEKFHLNYDILLNEILTGGGREKKSGEGETKARSIHQMILEYNPASGVPLSGYIGKIFQLRKPALEAVKTVPELFGGLHVSSEKAKEATAAEDYKPKAEDYVQLYGDMKLKHELPISKEQFEKKGGWERTIINKANKGESLGKKGFGETEGLGLDFVHDMMGIKLNENQKKRPNDFNQTSLENSQKWVNSKFTVEEGKPNSKGEIPIREVRNIETIRDIFPKFSATPFDVADVLVGTTMGIPKTLLKKLYREATDKELRDAGFEVQKSGRLATKAGQRPKIFREDLSTNDILEALGIKNTYDNTGKLVSTEYVQLKNDRSLAGTYRRLSEFIDKNVTNQTIREGIIDGTITNLDGVPVANALLNLGSGRSRKLFSSALEKSVNIRRPEEKIEFMKGMNTEEFEALYKDNLTQGLKNPLGRALADYNTTRGPESAFAGKDMKVFRKELLKIGEQLDKKLGIEGLDLLSAKTRVGKVLTFPQSMEAIEAMSPGKYYMPGGRPTVNNTYLFGTAEGIQIGRALDKLLMNHFEKKYGKGWYEAIMLPSNTSGTGVGMFKDGNILGNKIGDNRFALYATAENARDLANKINTAKTFDAINRANSNRVGDKVDLMGYVGMKGGSKSFDMAKAKEAFEHGETNKKHLREIVDVIKELYDSEVIDHRHIRSFLETAGGPMQGIIRKSGSLAILPKGSPAELFKIWPERIKKLNKDGSVKRNKKGEVQWESGWVLEHTIPTQYLKARIYEYILRGDKASKEAMDLTLKNFHTTFIPKALDHAVNKLYLSELPPEYLPGMDPLEYRYYRNPYRFDFNIGLENFVTGKNYDLNPNLTHTRAQAQYRAASKYNNMLFGKIGLEKAVSKKLFSEKLDKSKKIDAAIMLGRKLKKKPRGMSTFDFDDTLAKTKSGVLYTMPNISGKASSSRKAILLTGAAGAGKSTIIDGLGLRKQGFKYVNQDVALDWLSKNSGLPKNMNEFTREQADKWRDLQWDAADAAKKKAMKLQGKGDGIVIDGTGAGKVTMEGHVREFQKAGYDVKILSVESSLENALARNKARTERRLTDTTVKNSYEAVKANKKRFRELGVEIFEINTDNLKQGQPLPPEFVNKINQFTTSYTKGRLTAEEFALKGAELLEQGAKFDFSEFNRVVEGTPGPLLGKAIERAKKFGTDDMFVLTARAPQAEGSIWIWLKNQGLDIPLKNIKGLGNSTGEAKALWMLEKFSEGYNDMYFVDDAMSNVRAVRKVLDKLDIKSDVQQAKVMFSENLSKDVNNIIEHSLDIAPGKTFSKAEAKVRGADIKRRRVFMSDSAADLELLLEPLYGKGSKGIKNKKWFNENFMKPFERGYNDLNNAKQKAMNGYKALRNQNKDVVKSLDKAVEGTNFTTDMAIRTYIWNKNGTKIPDLAKSTENKLVEHVRNNPKLQAFAENVARLTGLETGIKNPSSTWWAETLASEMSGLGEGVSRKRYLQDWIDIKNEIFSEANLNKMETKLGSNWRNNIEQMFERMETGRTRRADLGTAGNAIMDYLNGSVGTIMNLNTRSATLQLISTVNFINHSFNNPLAASRAFANQPQYWKDFMKIMNSDMLKQRRAGLKINVTEAELAAAASGQRNKAKAALAWILKQGYIPTKVADSFAIAAGGATYYRNAIKKYMKEGLSKAEAEKRAWIDFQAVSERTQQSSRPDLLSAQQVSIGGRIILPFANTPMQMNRIMMKELLDIKNGRYEGFVGDGSITNKMSKIGYYGFVQSAIFAGLQSGLYALMANSDDDDLKAKKKAQSINTMADSFLRGMGIQGAVIAGVKNSILEFQKQNARNWGSDYDEVVEDLLNISPTIGSKVSKLDAAGNTYQWNKKEILEEGLTLDGPALQGLTMGVEAIGNIPVNRAYRKVSNIKEALDDRNEWWQRVMVGLGWSQWDVGIGQRKKAEEKVEKEERKKLDKEREKLEKQEQKERDKKKEQERKEEEGIKSVRCSGTKSSGGRCNIMIETKAKTAKCMYHKSYKPNEGSDNDGDGIKEYRCKATTGSGNRCKNRTENTSKKCYAHQ